MKKIEQLIEEFNNGNDKEKLNIEFDLFEYSICDKDFSDGHAQLLVVLWQEEIKKKTPKYEIITRCVFKINEDIDLELLDINIQKIRENIISESFLGKHDAISYCDKIVRHIKLAKIQKEYISNNISKLDSDIEIAKEEVGKIKETKTKIYTEFVSILGIFASIIFGVFGGFQEIQLIGQNLNSTPIPKLLIFSSLVMLGITIIVFLCFNAISKLIQLPLKSCNCEIGKCDCSLKQKHPTVFWSGGVFIYILCIGFALRLYKYDDFTFIDLYDGIGQGHSILPLLLIFTIPSLVIIYNFIILLMKKKRFYWN